ncbi:MAG: SprT family zinc-dependent metalloprotease [Gallionella sp.]|jgi:predicted metal-dependent hydrolase
MLKRLRNLAVPPGVEQRAAILSGKHITYTLKRSGNRRSIGLRIDDRGLTVSMPLRASEKWLHSVLQDKASWVVEKLDGWQTRKPATTLWRDGETIDYLGELLVLRVVQSLFASTLERRSKELWVFVADASETAHIEQVVSRWYQSEALNFFEQRAAHYAQLLNVAPRAIKLSLAKAQWGSCTVSGIVRLNVQLVKLPPRLIDYVVAHELAHLRELNHSAAFWQLVESVCPNYKKLRNELKDIAL